MVSRTVVLTMSPRTTTYTVRVIKAGWEQDEIYTPATAIRSVTISTAVMAMGLGTVSSELKTRTSRKASAHLVDRNVPVSLTTKANTASSTSVTVTLSAITRVTSRTT